MLSQLSEKFALKLKNQKQSPSAAIFSQLNSNEDQKPKKNKVFPPVCAIFIRLIEKKTKQKGFI